MLGTSSATAANGSGSSKLKNSAAGKRLFRVFQLELADKDFRIARARLLKFNAPNS